MLKLGEKRMWGDYTVIVEPNKKDKWQYRILKKTKQIKRSGFIYDSLNMAWAQARRHIEQTLNKGK